MTIFPQSYTYTIANGASKVVPSGGAFIRCREATAEFKLRLDASRLFPFQRGDWVRLPFRQFEIQNDSGASLDVTMIVSGAEFGSDGLIVQGGSGTTITVPSQLNSLADASVVAQAAAAIIVPAKATRRFVDLTLPKSAAHELRIGDSNIGAARGALLYPGGSARIDGTAAVYAYNDHASSAVSVNILETVE